MCLLAETAYAAGTAIPLIGKIETNIVNPIISILFSVAGLVFMFGLVEFMKGADNSGARTTGQRHMFFGIIGLAIMVSAFGLIHFICRTIGVSC